MMMRQATSGEKLATTGVQHLKRYLSLVITWSLLVCVTFQAWAQQPADQRKQSHPTQQNNMRLVGFNDLQGRSSYQPIIHRQGQRWIAYVVGGDPAWRTDRMIKVFDLSNPEGPVFIRDFGLVGQEPGSEVEAIPRMLHGPIAVANRIYLAYGATRGGILQIVDREKLLKGDPEPTPQNLLYPQVSRLDMDPFWGGHTSFPFLQLGIPDYADNLLGSVRDFVVLVGESFVNECQESQQATFLVDITDESKPFSVANFQVPESSGDFCQQGGRFGPHSMNESFTPIYYKRIVFISYFNAGVQAVDIRDPFHPEEIGFFIPAVTEKTTPSCRMIDGNARCKVVVQTNNVEVDDRGFIYIVDRAGTGLHILELTGSAGSIARFH